MTKLKTLTKNMYRTDEFAKMINVGIKTIQTYYVNGKNKD